MPSTSDSYIYKSLKGATSFRLVKLTGRTSEGLIDCKLKQFELKAAPRYRALSYYWGSSSPTRAICIGGRVRPLHDNLWQFLDQRVTDGHLGYYCTDALCIDQANVHERNHQIGYMGDIYSLASEVIIWLGRAEPTTSGMWLLAESYRYGKDKMKVPYGFNKQKRFVEVVQKSKVFNTMLHHTPCSIRELDCGSVVQHHRRAKVIKYKLAQAVLDLLNLPYWNRLWILQEVMLARTAIVSCGASSVPFDYLVKLVNYCELEEGMLPESELQWPQRNRVPFLSQAPILTLKARLLLIADVRQSRGWRPLWELLDKFCDGNCTDPRDKVYSLLGIVMQTDNGEHIRESIQVDYGKCLQDVFWDALFACKAPFHQTESIMSRLGQGLEMEWTTLFASLTAYGSRPSTTHIHRQCAAVVLHVAKAGRVAISTRLRRTSSKAYGNMFAYDVNLGSPSKVENAISIGLILATSALALRWEAILDGYESPWLCDRHHHHHKDSSLSSSPRLARYPAGRRPRHPRTLNPRRHEDPLWMDEEAWTELCRKCRELEQHSSWWLSRKSNPNFEYEVDVPGTPANLRISRLDDDIAVIVATTEGALVRSMNDTDHERKATFKYWSDNERCDFRKYGHYMTRHIIQ